ncbi:hypothetical protein [Scytonema sp. NUACC26]|uniref:hypothetical protein n=1 Tax=Scytonema sp. NUACC26 TaxID=3140176 RepID=UPI0034DC14CD
MLAGRRFGRIKTLQTIRVPKLIATQVLKLAHRLDSGEKFDFGSKSKAAENENVRKHLIYRRKAGGRGHPCWRNQSLWETLALWMIASGGPILKIDLLGLRSQSGTNVITLILPFHFF